MKNLSRMQLVWQRCSRSPCLFASSFYVFLFSVISKIEIYYSSHRKYCKKYGKCQGNIHLPNNMCFSIWGSSSQLHMAGTLSSRIWVRRSLWDLKVWLSSRKTRWAKLHTMDHENMDFKGAFGEETETQQGCSL